MPDFDATALKTWLENHGVRLCPPATSERLEELRSAFEGTVHPDVISLYETFDGCADYDFEVKSSFTIWPISRGLDFLRERGLVGEFPLADIEFAADVALCAVLEADAPIRWADNILPAHRSLGAFFETVKAGQLW